MDFERATNSQDTVIVNGMKGECAEADLDQLPQSFSIQELTVPVRLAVPETRIGRFRRRMQRTNELQSNS